MSARETDPKLIELLSKKELEVIMLIAHNFSSKLIAEKKNVSIRTIEKHRSNIITKLNLTKDTNSLTKWALFNKKYIHESYYTYYRNIA